MLDGSEIVAFVGVSDLERAARFYRDRLGLEPLEANPAALVLRSGTTQVRVTLVGEVVAAPYTVLGWAVDDLRAAVDDLVAAGVAFERFDGMDQDARGVWTAPNGDLVAWFRDPDGNVLSLSESHRPR